MTYPIKVLLKIESAGRLLLIGTTELSLFVSSLAFAPGTHGESAASEQLFIMTRGTTTMARPKAGS